MSAFCNPKPKRGKTYDYYRCHSEFSIAESCGAPYLAKGDTERLVLDAFAERIINDEILEDVYADARRQMAQDDGTRSSAIEYTRQELADVRARIQRLTAAIADAGHSKSLLRELGELERSEEALEREIIELDATTQPRPDIDYVQIVTAARLALQSATDTEKATVLRGFIRRIVVENVGDKIVGEIEYQLPGIAKTLKIEL